MKNRNLIRVAVLAALFAWPAVESYRLYAARQQLAANLAQQQRVEQKALALRAQNAQVAQNKNPALPE